MGWYHTIRCIAGSSAPQLCDDPDGWDEAAAERVKREGLHVYTELIHFVVQQKLTPHCKTTLPQLKKKNKFSIGSAITQPSFLAGINTTQAGDKMSPTIKPGILIFKPHFD